MNVWQTTNIARCPEKIMAGSFCAGNSGGKPTCECSGSPDPSRTTALIVQVKLQWNSLEYYCSRLA